MKIIVEDHVRNMGTFEGFMKIYYQMCSEYTSNEKAYEATERMYKSYFKKNRYKNFQSFKNSVNERLRNRKK